MSGLKLATLYGFYPHKLGFCGPRGNSTKKALLNYLSGQNFPEQRIRKILESFETAFSYYKLIAKSNGIKDPFDEKVVKAYWIGNQLLDKVPMTPRPHHSFHVLAKGSVTGRVLLEGKLLDLCRIGWGKVIRYKKSTVKDKNGVIIEYQPLQKKGKIYFLGKPVHKFIFWDKSFIPKLKIGDMVSTHWNHVIQILNKEDLANLKKYTQMTMDSLSGAIK